jgi:hypothetical protein
VRTVVTDGVARARRLVMRVGGFPGVRLFAPRVGVVRHGPDCRWKRVSAGVAPRSWAASVGRLLGVDSRPDPGRGPTGPPGTEPALVDQAATVI